MKRLIRELDDVFSMSNISPKRTGLSCNIWVDDTGSSRNVPHSVPRVKITEGDYQISVSISSSPKILAKSTHIPHSVMKHMKAAISYVSRNYDILLKYYVDGGESYDTQDMFDDLRSRGEFK